MSAGFVCFGLGLCAFSVALRHSVGGRAWVAAAVTGASAFGVAAAPLGASSKLDAIHGGFATMGYLSLALLPVLAARPLAHAGQHRAAKASMVVGVLAGASLLATALGGPHGLFQRLGLTLGDAWIAASAVAILSGRFRRR